jgi:hypothetical protein
MTRNNFSCVPDTIQMISFVSVRSTCTVILYFLGEVYIVYTKMICDFFRNFIFSLFISLYRVREVLHVLTFERGVMP